MRLRKDTRWRRVSVDETGRVIEYPETDAPDGNCCREVTVVLPENPPVGLALGPQPMEVDKARGELEGIDNAGATPEDIANGRGYQWPEPDSGRDYTFQIRPRQWIAAMAKEGVAHVSILVTYPEDD
jgi:hypothetical protein